MPKAQKIKIRKEEGRNIRFYDVYTTDYIDRILGSRGFDSGGGVGTGGDGSREGVDDIGGLGRRIGIITEDLNGEVSSFGVRLDSAISAGRDYFVVNQEREIFVFTPANDVQVGEGTVQLGDDTAIIRALEGSPVFEQSAQQEAENREFRERIKRLNENLEELELDLETLNEEVLPELNEKLDTLDGFFQNPSTIPSNYSFFEGIVTNEIWAQTGVFMEGWFGSVFTNALMADRIISNHIGAEQVTAEKIDVADLAASVAFIQRLFAREIALVLDTSVSPAKGGIIRSTAYDGQLSSSNLININEIGTQGWAVDYGGNAVFHNGFFRGTVIVEGGNATTFADINITILDSEEPDTRPDLSPLVVGDTWVDISDENRTYHWDGTEWVESDEYVAERGEVSVTIRSTTAPSERPNGDDLVVGDIWIDTDDGDKPRTWNGVSWIEMYTRIDGGSIVTGRIRSIGYQAGVQGWDIGLDGSAEFNNGTFRGTIVVTGGNAATNDSVNVTIRSITAPTIRDDGNPIIEGDVWIDTSDGDRPHTYDGRTPFSTNGWIRAYTIIDGGDIETGTVTANKIDVDDLFSQIITILNGGVIKSDNFDGVIDANGEFTDTGEVGFAITHAGNASFNNAFIRGDLIAPNFRGEGVFDPNGTIRLGTPPRIVIGPTASFAGDFDPQGQTTVGSVSRTLTGQGAQFTTATLNVASGFRNKTVVLTVAVTASNSSFWSVDLLLGGTEVGTVSSRGNSKTVVTYITPTDNIGLFFNAVASGFESQNVQFNISAVQYDPRVLINQDGVYQQFGNFIRSLGESGSGGGGGGGLVWTEIPNKPFETVGTNLQVSSNALQVDGTKSSNWDTGYNHSLVTTGNPHNVTASQVGAVPTGRTLTINGTALDLSSNRSWTVGSVRSITAGTGLNGGISNGGTSGTINLDVPVTVGNGGTGATSFGVDQVVFGNSSSPSGGLETTSGIYRINNNLYANDFILT